MSKLSFSIYNKGEKYKGEEPYFYNPDDFIWVKILEDNWHIILNELESFLNNKSEKLTPYFHKTLIENGDWKTFSLMFWNIKLYKNLKMFPQTTLLLNKIPHLVSASFSMLEPHTQIAPHHGDTNAIVRCHLGLKIPESLPICGMKVGTELKSWENGKVMIFCDAYLHSAFNNSNQKRYVLIVDIIKTDFIKKEIYVCGGVLAQLGLFYIATKLKIKKLPRWIFLSFHKLLQFVFMLAIPVKNKIEKINAKD